MEKLEDLPNVSRLSEKVVRILGQNPGKFTLQGTNTYLVGTQPPYILIDTGEGRSEYPKVLEQAMRNVPTKSDSKSSSLISDIIVTHRHHDHYGGLIDVLNLNRSLWKELSSSGDEAFHAPRIHKFPLPFDHPAEPGLDTILASLPTGTFTPNADGNAVHSLKETQELSSPGATLQILHTPGHTADSIMVLLREEKALFSADSVLGQGTAVFEDLSAYINSLQKVLDKRKEGGEWGFGKIYPGHGPVVEDGPSLVSTYINHRLEREEQIVKVLSTQTKTGSKVWTIWDIVSVIYAKYPENLWLPAAHGVGLHLKKLEVDGRARYLGGEGVQQQWELV